MRWKKHKEEFGVKKEVTMFLWFPLCIKGEWRWLETASFVRMRYVEPYEGYKYWRYIKWLD